MKATRHTKILELVNTNQIETQDELLRLLSESGFSVTQATVSRDMRELRLTKALSSDGRYFYKTSKKNGETAFPDNLFFMFAQSVKSIDCAGNMVVIQCLAGTANAVCAAFDSIHWEGVLGSLAGDDTMMVVVRSEETAKVITKRLQDMME